MRFYTALQIFVYFLQCFLFLYNSVKKSDAPKVYKSKITHCFTPSQLKMCVYANEFSANSYAVREFGHKFWGTPKPITILTDDKSVTRFFQTRIIPPALWKYCDYIKQFYFVNAHSPRKILPLPTTCPV